MTPNEFVFRTTDPELAALYAQTAARYESGRGTVPSERPIAEPQGGGGRPFDFITTYKGTKIKGSVPHGTKLRHEYKGQMLYATVDDGGINFRGTRYSDGNEAAHVAGLTVDTACTRPNGPYWWQRETSPGVWQSLYRVGESI